MAIDNRQYQRRMRVLESLPGGHAPEDLRDEDITREYATTDRQRDLRRAIEAQDLPVRNRLQEVVNKLLEAQWERGGIVLLQGETGSGKSVYSPQAVREALKQLGLQDRIVMVQPRKDAASNVARASAAVMGEQLGAGVGFSTSEVKGLNNRTNVAVVTPGIFLRYLIDGSLTKEQVGAIIVDELHENSIDYHLALGLIKQMHERGEAPLTLLTSATMHKEQIQQYFGIDDRDYLRIEGRAHDVRKEYLARAEREHLADDKSYIGTTVEKVKEVLHQGEGDILVFMPGAREIAETIRQIGQISEVEVLPLHGSLSPSERDSALSGKKSAGMRRRVIVSTNVAETSLTVPGITVVIDSCRQRSVRFNPDSGITEMGTEFISKDQAEQRAGRAGRISPGECYRMLTRQQFDDLQQHPESEIRKVNLSSLVLRLKYVGIDPQAFPFIDQPPKELINAAIKELRMVGALDESGVLTEIGFEMGDMPFEPKIARMLIEARKRNCVEAALIIAAFQREGTVLLGPSRRDEEEASGRNEQEKRLAAREKVQALQNVFDRGDSDILKMLNVFAAAIENGVFEASDRDRSPEGRIATQRFESWCKKHYIKSEALTHIAYKLRDYARYAGTALDRSTLAEALRATDDTSISMAIVAANSDNLLYHSGGRGIANYFRIEGGFEGINLSPSSEVFMKVPPVCVALAIQEGRGTMQGTEITRNYAHGVHPVSAEVLHALRPDLMMQSDTRVGYDPETDIVIATDGYLLAVNRAKFGEIKRALAGPEATVILAQYLAEQPGLDPELFAANKAMQETISQLYQRSRGSVPKLESLASWYTEKLQGITTWAEAKAVRESLFLQLDQFVSPEDLSKIDALYPAVIRVGDFELPITYVFYPSDSHSPEQFVATITIPSHSLFALHDADIPPFGEKEIKKNLTYQYTDDRGLFTYYEKTIAGIQEKANAAELERKFNEVSQTLPVMLYAWSPGEPLPTREDITAQPIQYATDGWGNPAIAYPGIAETHKRHDSAGTQMPSGYEMRYFGTEEEAKQSFQNVRDQIARQHATELREKNNELYREEAQAAYAALQQRIESFCNVIPSKMYNEMKTLFNTITLHIYGDRGARQRDYAAGLQAIRQFEAEFETGKYKNLLERWGTSVAREYERQFSHHGIESFVKIRNGQIFQNGVQVSEISIGHQVGKLVVQGINKEGHVVLLQLNDRGVYKSKFSLPDGSFAITKNADRIFQVELAEDNVTVTAVRAQVEGGYNTDIITGEGPMNNEQRAELSIAYEHLAFILEATGAMFPKPEKGDESSKAEAVRRLHGILKKAAQQLENIEYSLQQALRTYSTEKGRLGEVRALINRAMETGLKGDKGRIVNAEWQNDFAKAWEQLSTVIAENPDAQEFIDSGLTSAEKLTTDMRTQLRQKLPNLIQGEAYDLQAILAHVLNEV